MSISLPHDHQIYASIKEAIGEEVFNSLPEHVQDFMFQQERTKAFEKGRREYQTKYLERDSAMYQRIIKRRSLIPQPEEHKYRVSKFIKHTRFHEDKNTLIKNEPNIYSFSLDTIYSFENEFNEFLDSIRSKKSFVSIFSIYGFYTMEANSKIFASSYSFGIQADYFKHSIEGAFPYCNTMISKVLDNIYGYESIFKNNVVYCSLNIRCRYEYSPKSIENWGISTPELDLGFAKLFCANDKTINCIAQCSKFLWNMYIDNMDDFINYKPNNLIILQPKLHISLIDNINSYYDLEISPISPSKSYSISNPSNYTVLIFKEHIGVLHSFKLLNNRMNSITTTTPLKNPKNKSKISVCFDIECYFDCDDDFNQVNIPYLCCYAYLIDNKISEIFDIDGKDSILMMIENVSEFCNLNSTDKVELIAHNGGNYDFHYILSSLPNPSIISNILLRNNAFISFEFMYNNITFSVKDSYAFLLCSLANAAKAFDITAGKTDFPHHEVKSTDDLQKVFQKWTSIDENVNVEYEKEKMLITSSHYINYEKNAESKKLIEWSREYCMNDVVVLANVWKAFKNAAEEIFGAPVVDTSFTLAGMSFKLFKAHLSPLVYLVHPDKDDYTNLRKALYGGRCISINGIYKNIVCLDVKSLYPAAMAYYDQPYGRMFKVKDRNPDKLGVYYVTITTSESPTSSFFPLKNPHNKVEYVLNDCAKYNSWYTSVDIDIGISEGHDISYTSFDEEGNVGYEWEYKGKIFKDYIEQVLYKHKLQFEQENNKVKRQVIKIIMNSLWGKFAQKWIDEEYKIKHSSEIDYFVEKSHVILDTEYSILTLKSDKNNGGKPIQNGLFTLSWSRYHLKQLWEKGAKPGAVCVYSDTDSLLVEKQYFDLNGTFEVDGVSKKIIGSDIGQLELEMELNELICAGKKQYFGYKSCFKNGQHEVIKKCRFKGIPSKYIVPDMYSHLLQSKDNRVQVQFLKLNRIWGAIRGYTETKTLKAT